MARIRRGVMLVAVLLALGAPLSHAAQLGPLNILLTNDDGWDSVGIQTLKTALEGAGHHVTLVAPVDNRSGSSASLTLDVVTVDQRGAAEFAVNGTPATCVFLGISGILDQRPDLVVSGTNNGRNIGPETPFSGTVGAAVAALRAGLSAIAVSTDPPVDDETDPAFIQHFQNVANFTVRLVTRLQTSNPTPGLLPPRTALSVNYPPLSREQVRGVAVRVQGRAAAGMLSYQQIAPGVFIPSVGPPPPGQREVRGADGPAFETGFVTIVPIDGDYTSSFSVLQTMGLVLLALQP